ncbi:hypothetical protein TcCL_NonESM09557 [Trypanosoma cruzi]|nr:hypothetical protein TcCL_NonESM09557 [Trypanosoma cruzi]
MQNSTSPAGKVASPAEQRGKTASAAPMMRGRLHLLAAPASSADTKMQVTLCCTHDGRHILHNGNCILSHHTPQWICTASVSLLPFPLPENSSVAVAHPPTCRKSPVFLLPRTSHSSTANLILSPFILRILFRQTFRYLHPPTSVHVVSPSGARTTLTVLLIVIFWPH